MPVVKITNCVLAPTLRSYRHRSRHNPVFDVVIAPRPVRHRSTTATVLVPEPRTRATRASQPIRLHRVRRLRYVVLCHIPLVRTTDQPRAVSKMHNKKRCARTILGVASKRQERLEREAAAKEAKRAARKGKPEEPPQAKIPFKQPLNERKRRRRSKRKRIHESASRLITPHPR